MPFDWAKGYRAAIDDIEKMARARSIVFGMDALLIDIRNDARSIEHEIENREQKRKLREAKNEKQN